MSEQSGSRSDVEVEWQLDALDLRPVERWLAARVTPGAAQVISGLGIVAGIARRLVDSYVDTEDWRMGQAGYVLRVRRRSGRLETTLKDLSAADKGLRRRLEVTQALPASGFDGLDRSGEVGWRVAALTGSRQLHQVLEVRTRRRPFNLEMHGERVGELALDDTVIAIGHERRRLRLTRVEVEVLPAWVDAMRPFVEQLRRECGLQPATLSKFEAGLMAAGLVIPGLPDLGPTVVTPDCSLGELAYRVLRHDALAMLAQVPGTRLGEDIEALHQMRVATRRMRAGLDMFAEVLPVRARHIHAELGWLAGLLGEVRDLDVQIGRFDDWNEEMSGEHREALDELADLLVAERVKARADLLEAFDSKRYDRLVSGLFAMVSQSPSSRFSAARTPAVIAMPALVTERHHAARKAARRATRSGVASDYHRLRIRCKRLRYCLEFASGLYDGELKGFVRHMARLQDTLGAMQDAEVASSRLETIALTDEGATLSRATIFSMGGVAGRYHSEAEHLLLQLPELVGLLAGKEWKRAIGVMELRLSRAVALVSPRPAAGPAGARVVQGRARPALAKLSPSAVAPRRAGSFPGDSSAPAGSHSAEDDPTGHAPEHTAEQAPPSPRPRSPRSCARLARPDRIRTRALKRGDADYPERLREITSPPETLFVLGSLPPVGAVAIVGTRRPTRFGRDVAKAAATCAVASGLAVVSGLAAGIDTVAHEAALEAGAPTWAVIGSGIDVPTPARNAGLAEAIVSSGGGLIAQVPPGTPVSRARLVARDRIQAALCLAVLVCQCETSSGTMHTARFAVEQGRLLAVVRPHGSDALMRASSGNLFLIDGDGRESVEIATTPPPRELVARRGPLADVVIESEEELRALWTRLSSL